MAEGYSELSPLGRSVKRISIIPNGPELTFPQISELAPLPNRPEREALG
jgi:hypothetical protein